MRSRLVLVAHGQPARDALGDALAELRGPDPLAPATVVVARPRVGVALRRDLARRGSGVANVRCSTLAGLAAWLAAPRLDGAARPAGSALRRAALRAVLAEQPGAFAEVADHPATESALAGALVELRPLGSAALDALAGRSRKAAEVVRIHRAVRQRLATWSDDHDVLTAALEVVRAPVGGAEAARIAELGAVVAFLSGPLGPGPLALLEALAAAGPSAAVVGLTGQAVVDERARDLAGQLARTFGPPADAPVLPPVLAGVAAAPDAPSEVRTAVGSLLERAAAGVPLPDLALLHPPGEPYAAIVADELAAAGIPWHGPSRRALADTVTGSVLLGLLALAHDGRLARDGVVDWFSSAPVRALAEGGEPVPAARWDALSRRAGVVAGRAEWDGRLDRLARWSRAEADRLADDPDAAVAARHLRTNADQADALRAFVAELDDHFAGGPGRPRPTTWTGLVAWAEALLDRYLGPPPAGRGDDRADGGWPAEEVAARQAVSDRLRGLAVLDELPGAVAADPGELRRALARELAGPAPAPSPQGHGVFVGPIAAAVGLPLQAAVIVGLVEGVLPARWRDDPLLPEHERDGVEALGSRRARALDQQADLFAVVAGVPHVVGTWARTDGDGRPVLASRFLAELAPSVGDPAADPAAPPAALAPTSEAGLTLAELTRAHRAGRLDGHPFVVAEPALARALAIRRERRWGGFGPFEGRVGPSPVLSPPGGVELSPTALEAYAACPRRFLFEKVLEVEALDRPEEILELSAAHRGSLIHDVLERFVRQSPPPATPGAPWDVDARARLHALVDEVGAEYEHQGLTGRPLLWLLGRRRILRDLDDFLQADLALRRTWGVVPQADGLELSFGLRDTNEAAVSFGLPDGQTVRFRGRIDRVDRSPDGRRLVVIDYKTGSRRGTERIREGVGRGTKLQLPIYGLAAAQRFPAEEVVSLYWFVGRRERFHQEPLHVDGEVLAALGRAVQGLVAGIAAGSFPARPGKPDQNTFEHCRWCDYDVACSPHRAHTWERLRRDPALADYVGLVEPEALVDQLALEVSDA